MMLRILLLGALILGMALAATPGVAASHEPDCETSDTGCYAAWADYWVWQIYKDLKDPPCACNPDT